MIGTRTGQAALAPGLALAAGVAAVPGGFVVATCEGYDTAHLDQPQHDDTLRFVLAPRQHDDPPLEGRVLTRDRQPAGGARDVQELRVTVP